MTRKEEIRNASVAYNEKIGKLLVIGGDGILSEEEYLEFNKNPSFIAGALWADENMLDRVCEWVEDSIWKYIETKGSVDFDILKEVKVSEMVKDLRKVMEQ